MNDISSDIQNLKHRRTDAKKQRDAIKPLLDEGFKYALPYRKGLENGVSGERRVDDVFDHTAIDSAFRFAGKVQQNLWPVGQQNFELEPGPLVPENERDQWRKLLSQISAVVHGAFFDDGDFDLAFHEMALDLNIGTGAILMNSTSYGDQTWEPQSVPINELLLEQGAGNRISGIFWTRSMSVRELFETYPDGNYRDALQKLRKDNPETRIDVCFDSVLKRSRQQAKTYWQHTVWCEKQDDAAIDIHTSRTSIWAVTRYFRVPGETWGRGPVLLAMPSIKTLNASKRLQLQAAAIAMLGIYSAIDDGVFNPDNSPLTPGSFMKVARNGGPLGPSVQKFPDPRLDLTGLVVENMQMDVKATMMDDALPAPAGAVKSPTEILERVKRLASDHVGAYGRLIKEGVIPYVKRAIEVAYNKGLISTDVPIDQILIKVKVKSPLSIAHEMQRVQRIIQWLEIILGILGDPSLLGEYAKLEKLLTQIGRDLNVPEEFILSDDERAEVRKQKQEQQLAMAAAAAVTGGMGDAIQ